ncbi:hypothetical protein [uncultured Mediterranean phage]|nr:hypothetical protein [uncultured Mediterranean phage]
MAWFNLISLALKTGSHIYQNRQRTKSYMSDAQLRHAELMAQGKIEYQGKLLDQQKNDWKDEFVLIIISIPIALLAWSVFSDDPDIQVKVDLFFERFSNLPFWFQSIWVAVIGAIFGIKATGLIKRK